jgi:energy-coupling factor transport system ATP-binding protein
MGWPGRPLTVEAALEEIHKRRLAETRVWTVPSPAGAASPAAGFLEARELGYTYPEHRVPALRGVDLSVGEGEFVAILGQNGSGKSTLARHLNGLLQPTSGEMRVNGKPASQWSRRELARLVGHVFQNPDHQIFCRTVAEEVAFGLKLLGEGESTIRYRVAEALEVVGLHGMEDAVPFALTRGERQRVAVASVLAVRPRAIVMDEPTTGLDEPQQRATMEMLRRLHREGHTILVITHAMWVAAEYASRTVVMKEGRVLLDGPTREVFAREARLAEAALRPPPLVRLGNRIGTRSTTLEGMVRELGG